MTILQYMSLRNILLICLIFLFIVIGIYFYFISLTSIWIGFVHMHNDGFWVPILAGGFSFIVVFWFFFRIIRRLLSKIRPKRALEI